MFRIKIAEKNESHNLDQMLFSCSGLLYHPHRSGSHVLA
jgi:hypothetical protein